MKYKISKGHKKEIMKRIKEAGDPDNYKVVWKEGVPKTIEKKIIRRGKKAKSSGRNFELKVRRDLEKKGRIVDKWSNNVGMWNKEGDQITKSKDKYLTQKTKKEVPFDKIIFDKIIPAKNKFNPFKKAMMLSSGFPDFISIKHIHDEMYSVIGVEVKINGILSKIEKEKCAWYLRNKIFSQIWIAKAVKKGRKIEIKYDDFLEKYGKKYEK